MSKTLKQIQEEFPGVNIEELIVRQLIGAYEKNKPTKMNHGLQLVVLQRGWVFVGYVKQDGDTYTISDGACVRNWGTTRGLGELAVKGPLKGTILEPAPNTSFHEAGKILMIVCDEATWAGKIK